MTCPFLTTFCFCFCVWTKKIFCENYVKGDLNYLFVGAKVATFWEKPIRNSHIKRPSSWRLPQHSRILRFEYIFIYLLFIIILIIILSLNSSQNWLISLVDDLPVNLLDKIEKRNLVPNMKHVEKKFPTREQATLRGFGEVRRIVQILCCAPPPPPPPPMFQNLSMAYTLKVNDLKL